METIVDKEQPSDEKAVLKGDVTQNCQQEFTVKNF
jgi:hypothetical protein